MLALLEADAAQPDFLPVDDCRSDQSPILQIAPGPALPEWIGPYRVREILGAGGMSVVYSAQQRSPDREVAIKVIRPGSFGSEAVRRFEQEAELLGRLGHPGIAQIFDAGVHEFAGQGQPYFVME